MTNLKEDIKKKKAIYGSDVALKKMLKKEVSKVYISSDCPYKHRILILAKTRGVEVIELAENNRGVANICKKPFPISAVSFE